MDWRAVDRYLAGEAPPAEVSAVEQWLASDAAGRRLLDALRQMRAEGLETSVDMDAAWARLEASLDTSSRGGRRSDAPKLERAHGRRRWAMSVGIAAAVATVALGWGLLNGRLHRGASTGWEAVASVGTPREVVLTDGTRVVLSPGSRLHVAADFGGGARSVELLGEAYFEVAHDPSRPFTVRGPSTLARVLGTRFVVWDHEGERGRVVVAEGRVAVSPESDPTRSVEVTAGQRALLGRKGEIEVGPADVEAALGFTRGRLSMTDVSFSEALTEIGRWYGVPFRAIDPALADRRVRISLAAGAPIEQVLEALALAAEATYRRAGDTLVFTPR